MPAVFGYGMLKNGRRQVKDTILIDLDGVLRHWVGSEISDAESALGLARGTLLSWAFSHELLLPAITGKVTHEQWHGRVKSKLAQIHNDNVASKLIKAWNDATWEIDFNMLQGLKQLAPACQYVLVTNATSRLDADLKEAGLTSAFNVVVNSSKIGVAKPDQLFFRKALSVAGSEACGSVFIDDNLDNVNAARSMGIDSIRHQNVVDTLEFIQRQCT
ncbi:MAG: HAD-IA family hydrolase [Cyanobacteria bacterium P01_F01_bin.116]